MDNSSQPTNEANQPEAICLWNKDVGAGEILDMSGQVLWRYRPSPHPWWHRPCALLCRPDFILFDVADRELLRVGQVRRFPRRQFTMIRDASVLAQIEEQSIVATAYAVRFQNGPQWTMRKPLFSANFIAASNGGESIRVHIQREIVWYVHRGDTKDDIQMIAALAFIHSEHCRT